jgi:hypothetical protein
MGAVYAGAKRGRIGKRLSSQFGGGSAWFCGVISEQRARVSSGLKAPLSLFWFSHTETKWPPASSPASGSPAARGTVEQRSRETEGSVHAPPPAPPALAGIRDLPVKRGGWPARTPAVQEQAVQEGCRAARVIFRRDAYGTACGSPGAAFVDFAAARAYMEGIDPRRVTL